MLLPPRVLEIVLDANVAVAVATTSSVAAAAAIDPHSTTTIPPSMPANNNNNNVALVADPASPPPMLTPPARPSKKQARRALHTRHSPPFTTLIKPVQPLFSLTPHATCPSALEPFSYVSALPGKNVRDVLLDCFNHWAGADERWLGVVKQVVGTLHTASLVVDDIEDQSLTRRGQPSAHVVFGTPLALNAGNYAYFLALEQLLQLQNSQCVAVYTEEMLNLHRGQGRDLYWRDGVGNVGSSVVVSEEDYCGMVVDKTGGLFRLAARLLLACPTSSNSAHVERLLVSLSNDLACYFQIRDDLINLASPQFHALKGFCEDISEGKMSFLVLHSLRFHHQQTSKAAELLAVLRSKTTQRTDIKRALTLLHESDSFDYTLAYLSRVLHEGIEPTLRQLGGDSSIFSRLLGKLASELDDCHDVYHRVISM